MRSWIFYTVTGLLLFGPRACFYSDTDLYFVEPLEGDPPQVNISTSLDTLNEPAVYDSLQVDYLVEISGGEFYYVIGELASTTVFESDSSRGTFWITSSMADSGGRDTLFMSFYYSSNTNSLADKLGYEARVEILDYALNFMMGGAK
jgi:hypothetical protein